MLHYHRRLSALYFTTRWLLSTACQWLTIECWSGHACLKSFKLEVVFFGGIVML